MAPPDRMRTFLATTACVLASFDLNYLPGLIGLIAALALGVVAYGAASGKGPAAAL